MTSGRFPMSDPSAHAAPRRPVRHRRGGFAAITLLLALVGIATGADAAITITRTSSSAFYVSSQAASNGIRNMYVAYRITNTGAAAEPDVWVKLDTFTGGIVSLASQEDGLYRLYTLNPGESKMAYLYLTASAVSPVAQGHTVRVYDRRPSLPGAVELTSQVFSLSEVRSSLDSGANKVDLLIQGPDPGTLGGIITLTVFGRTGTIGSASDLEFSAASLDTWPADIFELYRADITFNDIAGSNCTTTLLGTYADQLTIPWSTTACYTAVYKLRVRNTTPVSTPTSPAVHIASGANFKHTDAFDIAALSPISPVASGLRLVKHASEDTVLTGDQVTYTLHVTSSTSNSNCPVGEPTCNSPLFDSFVDVLPTAPGSPTYVPGSARLNGGPLADPFISGSTLTWSGAFAFAAGGSMDISYDVTFPNTAGLYLNSATGYVMGTKVDTTVTTLDNAPGQAAVLVRQPSDLVLTKSGPPTVAALGPIIYTIKVVNQGPRPASGVAISDTLPAGVTFVLADNGGGEAGGVVSWPAVATLAPGDSVVRTVTVTAPASGTLLNIAACSSTNEETNPANSNGSAPANRVTTTVLGQTDLTLTKSGPATVNAAQNFTYTLTVTNNGPSDAAAVVVQDTLPAGVTFVSADNGGLEASGVVTWPILATLANGGNAVYTVTVTAPATGTLLNVARADAGNADPDTTNNNGTALANRVTTTVTELADLALVNSGPAAVSSGQTYGYTLTVTNNGPSDAAAVVVQDTLPAGVTFVSADNGGTEAGGVVTWPALASLANGASAVYTVTVTAPATGTLLNVARVDAGTSDPDTTNNNGTAIANRVTTTVTELADLALVNTGPATVNAAQTYGYTLTVTNNGPSDATAVVVQDTLPAGVTFVSADNGGTEASGVVTWPILATLADGANAVYTVTVTAPATGTLLNVARADAGTADPDTTNNNGAALANRVTTVVAEVADVALTNSGPATVNAAQTYGYTLTVTNNGPSDAAAVVVRDTLPAGVTFVSADNGGSEAAGVVTWPAITTLANGANSIVTVTVTAPPTGTLVDVGAALSSTPDPDPANNDGSAAGSRVTTVVAELADVALAISGPAAVGAAQTYTYTLTVTNNGPSDAAAVVVQDTLPAGVTFVSADNGGLESGGVVTWPAITTLANGASSIVTVTVTAPPTGTLVDVGTAISTTTDPDPTNNDGSAAANRVTTVVSEVADVALANSGPATVGAAQNITYTLTVTNNGPSAATAVVVQNTLPAGVTFVSADNGGSEAAGVVTWPGIATLANGASSIVTVTVTAPATGTLLDVGAAVSTTTDPDPANNDGSAAASRVTTVVDEVADVALAKTGPAGVNALGSITYTLTVTNNGPSDAAAVVVRDTLPAGVTFVSADNGGSEAGGIVTWPAIGALANGANAARTVTVIAPVTGTLLNIGAAASTTPDPILANNDGSAAASRVSTTVADVDLAIEMTHTGQFFVGQAGLYTITVRNLGSGTANSTITVTDTLPAGLGFAASSFSLSSGWSYAVTGTIVTWTHPGPLAPGGALAFGLPVDVSLAAVPGVINAASVANAQDANPANNRVTDLPTLVGLDVSLVAEKASSRAEAEIGDLVDYAVTIRNLGTSPVPDLVVNDVLPVGFVYRAGSARLDGAPLADPAGAPGPTLQFGVGSFASGATGVLRYRVEVGPGATLGDGVNRASAASAAAGVASNAAAAAVRVKRGVFTDEGTIAGKVFLDCDCSADSLQGAEELGVPGVRVALEDGTATITDVEGKFHFVGVSPRLHILRVDRATLPAGTRPVLLSNRQAGDGWSHFVDLKAGELFRADFALHQTRELLEDVLARRERGEIAQPTSIDPALGTATITGRGTGPGAAGHGYRGLFESRPYASTGRSMPLAGELAAGATPPDTAAVPAVSGQPADARPTARPSLLAVGLVQGRLERWSKAPDAVFTRRDRFEDELRDLSAHSDDGRMLAGARAGLFLAGPVGRDFRIAVRYDSEHDPRQRFFRDIRPDEHYPIYGDASVTEFFGQSRDRVYAKLERGRSFVQYGDLATATLNPLRALGAFNRVLNGGLSHVEWAKGALEAFGSRGLSRQVVDELPALGISGPYALSRSDGLANSERVEIVTRDRNRPSVIVDRKVQERFLDYSIEPFTGRIVFRRAVPSVDENLNPISIRITYESESGGEHFWVYGVQGQFRPAQGLELGGSAVREDDPLGERTILSANGGVEVAPGVTALGEFARSDSAGVTGNATRAEVRARWAGTDLSVFGMRTDRDFSNPSAGFGPAREELGARGGWQARKDTRVFGEALYSRDRIGTGHRSGGQLGITQRLAERIMGELAFRATEESIQPATSGTALTPGATPNETRSLRARITDQVTPRASLFGEYEQDLKESDQRRAAVGGDFRLASRTRAYGRYELISSFAGPYALNPAQERYSAVLGLASDDTPAGTVFSEYRLRDAIGGREAQAAIGLRNRWTVRTGLHLDGSVERVTALQGGGPTQNAAGFGVDYTAPERWRGTGRVEWRRASGDDQVFGSLGYAQKLTRDWALLGRGSASFIDQVRVHGRGSIGVAWRETDRNRWNALARFEGRVDRDGEPGGPVARTTVGIASAHLGYQPTRPLQLRGQMATRVTDASEESGTVNASLLALRGTWDFHRLWDGGLIGRTLFTDHARRRQEGLGAEIGFTPLRNLRLAGGYNLLGYKDGDLNGGSRSEHGLYLDVGFKLDEDVFRFLNPNGTDEPKPTPKTEGGK
jgi:uncharacterized repeat protein (TIGR01451 family)